MDKDDDKTPVNDAVVTKPEETTPAPEVTPPAVTPPQDANEGLKGVVDELTRKVDELSGMVAGVLASGGQPDSTPVKKPWTHRW